MPIFVIDKGNGIKVSVNADTEIEAPIAVFGAPVQANNTNTTPTQTMDPESIQIMYLKSILDEQKKRQQESPS